MSDKFQSGAGKFLFIPYNRNHISKAWRQIRMAKSANEQACLGNVYHNQILAIFYEKAHNRTQIDCAPEFIAKTAPLHLGLILCQILPKDFLHA